MLVEDHVVAPVEAVEAEGQGLRGADGDTCCLREVELAPELLEGFVGVAEAVEEDQDIGGLL